MEKKQGKSGEEQKGIKSPFVWVNTAYFSEGYPYGVVNNLAEILFKERGASLAAIGLTSLLHLPWNLKFIWGPLLDRYATKRRWLIWTEAIIAVLMIFITLGAAWQTSLMVLAGAFLLLAFLSATHDIAIDGLYLEALDRKQQAQFVGHRSLAYKVSSVFITGPLIIIIGKTSWTTGFLVCSIIMGLLLAFHIYALPKVEIQQLTFRQLFAQLKNLRLAWLAFVVGLVILAVRYSDAIKIESLPNIIIFALLGTLVLSLAMFNKAKRFLKKSNSAFASAYLKFLEQEGVGWILAFIVFYRTGESFLSKMKWPFLHDDMQMTLEQYGWANGTIGTIAAMFGTFLGGWLISKHGLRRWLWPFLLMQNALNLLFMWLAFQKGSPPSLALITGVISLDHFGSGLGTAVFMIFIMRCCHPDFKAAHMSLLTAFMSLSFTIAGVSSGVLAEKMGFATYFAFTFLASIPAMLLVPRLPQLKN